VLFHLSLLALTFCAARRVLARGPALAAAALLATTPWLSRGATGGLADVPLAALVLLGFLLLARAADRGLPGRALALAGVAAGLLPWMKSEGAIWLALATGAAALRLVGAMRRGELAARAAALGGAVFVAGALDGASTWASFLAVHGTVRTSHFPLTIANLAAHVDRVPRLAFELARRLVDTRWNAIFVLAAFALVARRGRALARRDGWVLVPAALFVAAAFSTYLLSRFDPYLAHLRNSAERLLLQALPLAVWFLAAQAADAPPDGEAGAR